MKIAVYSGSFNPLHIGHEAIMRYLTNEGQFDMVYLVISPKNPLKRNISADSAEDRYKNAVEAIKRHPDLKVIVDDIELKMPPPYYTIKTLDALKTREPENDFTLIIGADNLSCIHEWKHFPRILTDYGVVVYPRKGFNINKLKKALLEEYITNPEPYVLDSSISPLNEQNMSFEDILQYIYNIRLIEAPLVDISSTEIRLMEEKNENVSNLLM